MAAHLFCSSCECLLEEKYNFCPDVQGHGSYGLLSVREATTIGETDEKDIVESYFCACYDYETILCFLQKHHVVNMSMSTLKRRHKQYNL